MQTCFRMINYKMYEVYGDWEIVALRGVVKGNPE